MVPLRACCRGDSLNVGLAAEADVFRRGADEDVEDARLDAEVVDLDVVEGEELDGTSRVDGLRFAGG